MFSKFHAKTVLLPPPPLAMYTQGPNTGKTHNVFLQAMDDACDRRSNTRMTIARCKHKAQARQSAQIDECKRDDMQSRQGVSHAQAFAAAAVAEQRLVLEVDGGVHDDEQAGQRCRKSMRRPMHSHAEDKLPVSHRAWR